MFFRKVVNGSFRKLASSRKSVRVCVCSSDDVEIYFSNNFRWFFSRFSELKKKKTKKTVQHAIAVKYIIGSRVTFTISIRYYNIIIFVKL